jgi:Pterin 4 alpha carbinolamine dehydratase
MSKVARLSKDMNHHPEWKNIYNVVEVTLSTHDCGGISELVSPFIRIRRYVCFYFVSDSYWCLTVSGYRNGGKDGSVCR